MLKKLLADIKFYSQQSFREIRHRRKFTFFFVVNLGVGLSGLLLISSFNFAVDNFLAQHLREQLTGDMEISADEPFSQSQLDIIAEVTAGKGESTKILRMVSMASSLEDEKSHTKLVRLMIIEPEYPLVGQVVLKKRGAINPKVYQELAAGDNAWISEEVAGFLNLKSGQIFKIGAATLVAQDIAKREPLTNMMGLMPKIYLTPEAAAKTGLLSKTSRIRYLYKFAFSQPQLAEELKEILVAKFEQERLARGVTKKTINVRTYAQSGRNISTLTDVMGSYLTVMAMMAFILSSLGTMYLYRHYFNQKRDDFAIFKILGLSSRQVLTIFGFQMVIISALATISSLAISGFIIYLINFGLENFWQPELVQQGFVVYQSGFSILKVAAVAFVGMPIFCLPALANIGHLKLGALFSEFGSLGLNSNIRDSFSLKAFLRTTGVYLPLILFFGGVTLLISFSRTSAIFFGILLALFFIFALLGRLVIILCRSLLLRFGDGFGMRHALLLVVRYPSATIQFFVGLGLAGFMLFLIPNLYYGIKSEISIPKNQSKPQFFLFDIQPEQIPELEDFTKQEAALLYNLSPMVRAEWLQVNEVNLSQWRAKYGNNEWDDAAEDGENRQRGYNLSYKNQFNIAEKITAGPKEWGPYKAGYPKVSLETGFAKEYGLGIGDILTFNIAGDIIKAEVYNLRNVKWNYFFPNFFMVMQPGVLEDYPQIGLANIKDIDPQRIFAFNYSFSELFPNIPLLNVRLLIERLIKLSYNVMLIVLLISFLGFIAGLIGLQGIMIAESDRQRFNYNLFKVLGVGQKGIWRLALGQYLLLVTLGTLLSLVTAGVGHLLVGRLVFSSFWNINWGLSLAVWLLLNLLATSWLIIAAAKVILASPAKIFQQGLS